MAIVESQLKCIAIGYNNPTMSEAYSTSHLKKLVVSIPSGTTDSQRWLVAHAPRHTTTLLAILHDPYSSTVAYFGTRSKTLGTSACDWQNDPCQYCKMLCHCEKIRRGSR
jgi:hypothetical protein